MTIFQDIVTIQIAHCQYISLRISQNSLFALGAAVCFGALVIRAVITKSRSSLPLPPSPPSWRLQGHFLPPASKYLTIGGWIEKYGPIITIRSGLEKTVIIGRHKAAMDIMERQGALLTDRPRMVAIGEILNGGLSIPFTRTGERWRQMRRALHINLQPKAADEYQPLQTLYAKRMVLSIFDDPSNFADHIVTYSATVVMKVAYGKNTPTVATEPEVIKVRQVIETLLDALRAGPYLAEWIPWLKYIPWYCQELKNQHKNVAQLHLSNLNRVKQEIQRDEKVGPSFTKYLLANTHLYKLTEIEMAFLAGVFFGAGSETVAATMYIVLVVLALFPEEQAEVHDELDRVIGRSRAPAFADRQSLPRLQAFISEALRWRPLYPSGLPHRATKDIIWENYCIPAGTTVIGDNWAISRDPEVFPQPDEFKPERWIDDRGLFRNDLKFFVFGYGRRICPAQHIVNRSVFITSLLTLWAFQLTPDRTKPVDDTAIMNSDMQSCHIKFKPRVPEAELRRILEELSGDL